MRFLPYICLGISVILSGCSSFQSVSIRNLSDFGNTRISSQYDDGELSISIKADLSDDVSFNETDTEIVSFPSNSQLELSVAIKGGVSRRLLIERKREQAVSYRFYRNGKRQAFDAAAQTWFAEQIPMILRETGLDWQARLERLHAQGDHARVLEEISLIRSDYVQGLYTRGLATHHRLSADDQVQLLHLTANMQSDSEQARALTHIYDSQELSLKAWEAMAKAMGNVSSDSELSNLLKGMLYTPWPTDVLRLLLAASTEIQSDTDLSALLIHVQRHQALEREAWAAWIKAAATVQSDSQLANALVALVEGRGAYFPHRDLADLAKQHVQSDSELSRVVMSKVVQATPVDGAIEWLKASHQIQSDSELSNLLRRILSAPLPTEVLVALFEASKTIQSDSKLADVLVKAVRQQNMSDQAWAFWQSAASTIQSDGELSEILVQAIRVEGARPPLADLLGLAGNQIQSDSDLSEVLKASLARKLVGQEEHHAYGQAMESISSTSIKSDLQSILGG